MFSGLDKYYSDRTKCGVGVGEGVKGVVIFVCQFIYDLCSDNSIELKNVYCTIFIIKVV